MTEAYPLHWPAGRPRTKSPENARFKASFASARDMVAAEVQRLVGRDRQRRANLVISSNVALRQDGLPYAGRHSPEDAGVAVYFTYKGKQMAFACDRWRRVEQNLQAIAKTIEALRGIARWGTGDMLEAAFTGFAGLPDASRHWTVVLCIPFTADAEQINSAFRDLAILRHPDRGGTNEAMAELNRAREDALLDAQRRHAR